DGCGRKALHAVARWRVPDGRWRTLLQPAALFQGQHDRDRRPANVSDHARLRQAVGVETALRIYQRLTDALAGPVCIDHYGILAWTWSVHLFRFGLGAKREAHGGFRHARAYVPVRTGSGRRGSGGGHLSMGVRRERRDKRGTIPAGEASPR